MNSFFIIGEQYANTFGARQCRVYTQTGTDCAFSSELQILDGALDDSGCVPLSVRGMWRIQRVLHQNLALDPANRAVLKNSCSILGSNKLLFREGLQTRRPNIAVYFHPML